MENPVRQNAPCQTVGIRSSDEFVAGSQQGMTQGFGKKNP